jgi:hypothetical protein
MGMPTPNRIEVFVKDALRDVEEVITSEHSSLKRYRAATHAMRKLGQAADLLYIYLEGEQPLAIEEAHDIFGLGVIVAKISRISEICPDPKECGDNPGGKYEI